MTKSEAEDFVYKSYLKAAKYQDYNQTDSEKRHPELTKKLIRKKTGSPSVVVTGSKGKGSVANMISQILQTKYKVGLMTSPHITDFCERFKINGKNISDEDFIKYMAHIQPQINKIDSEIPENICVSPMGIQTILALEYFNDFQTDFNIFECGKGAKFDDVNNVLHQYAVINSIFLEHTRELGGTLEAIAQDKAHVITGEQKCVFTAQQTDSVLAVIKERAEKFKVPLRIYGRDFSAKNICFTNRGMTFDVDIGGQIYKNISLPLLGIHQAKNCALAMALCKEVLGDFDFEAVKVKLSELNYPGRMEIISKEPLIILDACINSASCENVKKSLKYLNINKITCIIGIPDDKDFAGVIREMKDLSEKIILTKSNNPHYIFTEKQCDKMAEEGIETVWTNSVEEAIEKAKKTMLPLVILGTTSVISDVKLFY